MDHCEDSLRYCNWLVGLFPLCLRYFMYENFKTDACLLKIIKKRRPMQPNQCKKKPQFKTFNFFFGRAVIVSILPFELQRTSCGCCSFYFVLVFLFFVFFQTWSKQPYCSNINQFICLLWRVNFSYSTL